MISDFFYPNMGGVENHIYHLSQCLTDLGHTIIIVTHAYPPKQPSGITFIYSGRIKVYYLPLPVMYNQCTLPTIFAPCKLYKDIFSREHIDLLHGHQAFSVMCHEGILHARTMGIPCCFTDHSLFGFADTSSILTNKLLKFTLSDVAQVICVSNTSKENTVLRAALDPLCVSVIPNAVDATCFLPKYRPTNRITVVVLSRLVYRKGIDFLIAVVPAICARFHNVDFFIAGDGPKKIDLEQMREKHLLFDRVRLVGPVATHKVSEALNQGDIFLNCSLTEAFCMAIVEAACCGLRVVSTSVGGVPEVLPEDIIKLASPDQHSLIQALSECIEELQQSQVDEEQRRAIQHDRVAKMYSWPDVAKRTEAVYLKSMSDTHTPLIERMKRVYGTGEVAGKLFVMAVALNYILHKLLEFVYWVTAVIIIVVIILIIIILIIIMHCQVRQMPRREHWDLHQPPL